MIVKMIAGTSFYDTQAMQDAGYDFDRGYTDGQHPRAVPIPTVPDELAEFAGRLCYLSWSRPNESTRTNQGYLDHILEVKHESILEHATATFYVAGVSRSLSHELVRHRHLSFSQMSQRFVDESGASFVVPPAMQGNGLALQLFTAALAGQRDFYGKIVDVLERAGLTRKQAREAARSVLPNATNTRFVVTGNLRAWRDVLNRRLFVGADAEIRIFAGHILRALLKYAPNCMQDFAHLVNPAPSEHQTEMPTEYDDSDGGDVEV